jgi:hypothetical protein
MTQITYIVTLEQTVIKMVCTLYEEEVTTYKQYQLGRMGIISKGHPFL